MAIYGRKPSGNDVGLGISDTNSTNVRATVFPALTEHAWFYRWGIRMGYRESAASVRGHVWNVSSGNPGSLRGNTAQVSVPQQMWDNGTAPDVVANLTAPVQGYAGTSYSIGYAAIGPVSHGMIPAAQLSTSYNRTMYFRSTTGTGPYNPMGYTSSSTEGWLSTWLEYEPNVAPNTPINRSPTGTLTSGGAVTFTGAFRDDNETVGSVSNPNEKLKQYRIQLRPVGGSLQWDATYSANGTEQQNRAFSRGYGGTGSLTPGTNYEWRCQVSDQFDAWSAWSSWLSFVINAGGEVTALGGVTGKQTTLQPNGYQARWNHANGLAMDTYNLQVLQGQTVVRDVTYALSAANGATFTMNPSFSALEWGVDYAWRARGRDTTGVWSDWSDQITFWTNHQPTTPTNLSPPSGTVTASRPLLQFVSSDADDTAAPNGPFQGYVRIKNSGGTLIAQRTATHVGNNVWQYQTTSSDLASYATYKWDAFASDGVVSSAASAEYTIVYATGPTVTITAPAQNATITTSTPTYTWSVSAQQRYRAVVYTSGTNTVVWDSGWVTSTATSRTQPAGFLRNATSYDLVVTVENTSGLQGSSARRTFTLQYPAPPVITGVTAAPMSLPGDNEPSSILISWDQATGTGSTFARYRVYRIIAGELVAAEVVPPIATITSVSQTTYLDTSPASGTAYQYYVIQEREAGVDTLTSPASDFAGPVQIDLIGVVLSDAVYGDTIRAVLIYIDDSETEYVRNQNQVSTWDDGPPTVIEDGTSYRVIRESYRIRDQAGLPALAQIANLEALSGLRPSGDAVVAWYRDDLGRVVPVRISALSVTRQRLGRFTVSLELLEVAEAQ